MTLVIGHYGQAPEGGRPSGALVTHQGDPSTTTRRAVANSGQRGATQIRVQESHRVECANCASKPELALGRGTLGCGHYGVVWAGGAAALTRRPRDTKGQPALSWLDWTRSRQRLRIVEAVKATLQNALVVQLVLLIIAFSFTCSVLDCVTPVASVNHGIICTNGGLATTSMLLLAHLCAMYSVRLRVFVSAPSPSL